MGIASVYTVQHGAVCNHADELDLGWRGGSNLGEGINWDTIQGDWFGEERQRGGEAADRHGSADALLLRFFG